MLGIAAIRLGHEAFVLANRAAANAGNGLATPEWISRLPFVGSYIADWWAANLAQPGAARDILHHLNDGFVLVWARALGTELLHRLLLFFFTLLTLFFLYRDGAALARQIAALADRLFGDRGRLLGLHLISALRATVNGLVLVGLGEGVAWGIACAVAGLPRPTMIGAVSGLLAIIPFGLPISIFVCAAVVMAEGHLISAAALVAYGFAVGLRRRSRHPSGPHQRRRAAALPLGSPRPPGRARDLRADRPFPWARRAGRADDPLARMGGALVAGGALEPDPSRAGTARDGHQAPGPAPGRNHGAA